ncbi:MAG: 50S ribosomal protein L37ae [Methanomethylovorans sp.]|nr:50S ribosomal protein L37ae [Methanomethylovorans sp.]
MAKKYSKKGRVTRSAGRFGVRYGRKDRKLVADLEEKMRMPYICSKCARPAVRRIGTGIWQCKKCDYTFAGGTFLPQTPMGMTVARSVKKATEFLSE